MLRTELQIKFRNIIVGASLTVLLLVSVFVFFLLHEALVGTVALTSPFWFSRVTRDLLVPDASNTWSCFHASLSFLSGFYSTLRSVCFASSSKGHRSHASVPVNPLSLGVHGTLSDGMLGDSLPCVFPQAATHPS